MIKKRRASCIGCFALAFNMPYGIADFCKLGYKTELREVSVHTAICKSGKAERRFPAEPCPRPTSMTAYCDAPEKRKTTE